MTVSVHNPDQYMASLGQIIAQGRKRIGLLVGAAGPPDCIFADHRCSLWDEIGWVHSDEILHTAVRGQSQGLPRTADRLSTDQG